MSSKLSIYNTALGYCRQRKIADLSESSESRRIMDTYWTDVVAYCLEQGFWKFAMKTQQIYSNDGYTAPFGFTFQFDIPSDLAKLRSVSASDRFDPPLLDIRDEAGCWYADVEPIYVSFVSNANDYGNDISLWSVTFADYVASRLAAQAAPRLTGAEQLVDGLEKREKAARIRAKANDAMNDPPGFAPTGRWVRSRRGLWPADKARSSLIG